MGNQHTDLKDLLDKIARKIQDRTLTTVVLSKAMSDTFGGSDASGAWTWRMAYDVME